MHLLSAHSLGLPLTPGGALFIVAVIGLGLTVPSTAGGLGLAQYLAVLVLCAHGMELGGATAYSILAWVVSFLTINLAGQAFLLAGTVAPGEKSNKEEPEGEPE